MFFVADAVCRDRQVMTDTENEFLYENDMLDPDLTYQTCSETSCVIPAAWSSHLPRNNSPKKGFNGLLLPSLSPLWPNCAFRDPKNHFKTRTARFSGFDSRVGAINEGRCSVHQEGNST